MTTARVEIQCPAEPFRGLEPYRFSDQAIFFERELDVRKLIQLTTIYRASLLYGESGAGKSSLINAGFIPALLRDGVTAERIRVQPRKGAEFIVERIERSAAGDVLPSRLLSVPGSQRETLSASSLIEKIRALEAGPALILIFDQFEELHTLATDAAAEVGPDAIEAQNEIINTLVTLIREPASSARLLFVFREDYLAKFERLFYLCPELPDRFLRLTPPTVESLPAILRGPFETDRLSRGCWKKEIQPSLAAQLQEQLRPAAGRTSINLAKVQIAAVQLWRAADPEAALERRGVQGLIEDYLDGALSRLGRDRAAAEILLTLLITRQGTRKILLETEAVEQAYAESRIDTENGRRILGRLVNETKLVRRDYYRNAVTYEIVNEFLVPWIRALKLQRAQRQARKVWMRRAAIVAAAFIAIAGAIFAWQWKNTRFEVQKNGLIQTYEISLKDKDDSLKRAQKGASDTLKLLSDSKDDQVKKLAAQLAELQQSTNSKMRELNDASLNLAKAQDTLQSQLNDANARLASANADMDRLKTTNQSLQTENQGLKTDNQSLKTALDTANGKVTALNAELEKLRAGTNNSGTVPGVVASPAGPVTRVLAIGISKYMRLPALPYASADARMLSDFFSTPRGGSARAILLADDQATTARIRARLTDLTANSRRGETIVLVISAHSMSGGKGGSAGWLLTYDSDPESPESTAVPMSDIISALSKTSASKIVGFFDFQSGPKIPATASIQSTGPNEIFFFASRPGEQSFQKPEFGGGHGAFSYFVVDGLNGAADANHDGVVTVDELRNYINTKVPPATGGQQHPTYSGYLAPDSALTSAGVGK